MSGESINKAILRGKMRGQHTLPQTNSSPLEMDGWNTTFLLGNPIFRGELLVSGRVNVIPRFLILIGRIHGPWITEKSPHTKSTRREIMRRANRAEEDASAVREPTGGILLMEKKSQSQPPFGCKKNLVNNGLGYTTNLNWWFSRQISEP